MDAKQKKKMRPPDNMQPFLSQSLYSLNDEQLLDSIKLSSAEVQYTKSWYWQNISLKEKYKQSMLYLCSHIGLQMVANIAGKNYTTSNNSFCC